MAYKNASITRDHMKLAVRKVWRLYFIWQMSGTEIDQGLYLQERARIEKALKVQGVPSWKRDFTLP